MAKNLIAIGRQTIGGLADFFSKDVVKVFAAVYRTNSFKMISNRPMKAR